MKNKLGKVYAFSTKALRSHGIQESAHLVSLLDRSSILEATDFQILYLQA